MGETEFVGRGENGAALVEGDVKEDHESIFFCFEESFQIQLMVNCWLVWGPVVWIPIGSPKSKGRMVTEGYP